MGFTDDTSLTIKQRNVAWTAYEKATCQGKGFFERLSWKMANKPMELICKCDLRNVMHGLVGGTILFAYTVITSHSGTSVAFALALTNWCCLGLETNLLRVFLFIKQSKLTMDLLFFSQVLNALVAIASVIVVCVLDISETTSGVTSFTEANIAIYIAMNLLNIVGNVIGSVAFNALRKRVYALSLSEELNVDVIPIQSP